MPPNGWRTRARSAAPVVGTLKICDEDGNELPAGEAGTIYFADGRPFEYHNDPKKTAESRHARGWSTLGDVGYLDADGFLYLTDRKAFMIISGGVNIYPQECREPADRPSQGDGLRRVRRAQRRFRRGSEGRRAAARHGGCRPRAGRGADRLLPRAPLALKCPRSIDFEAELPRHPTGKLYKRLLRDRYWQAEPAKSSGRI